MMFYHGSSVLFTEFDLSHAFERDRRSSLDMECLLYPVLSRLFIVAKLTPNQ